MTGFVLYVQTKNGIHVVKTLGPHSSVGMLKLELSKVAGIPISSLCVLSGFPPVHLQLTEDQSTLESNNICSRDRLIVQEKNSSTQEESMDQDYLHQDSNKSGVLLRKAVPPDNSCLFTSVRFALFGEVDSSYATAMRQIIAEVVANDPETFSEAFLGRPNAEYCEWILRPTSWGGGIELAILSKFYTVEIVVLDTVNGILNRFGEDQAYIYRILLFFDGVHYDPLYVDDFQDNISRKPKTLFLISDEEILLQAATLAKDAKASRQCSNIKKFTLQCQECSVFLSGENEAGAHARETGHKSFSEVN